VQKWRAFKLGFRRQALGMRAEIMSQEILFLLFMVFELAAILSLYQFVLIPRMAHAASIKTNDVFEQRMLDKSWDIPAMLEDYTGELINQDDMLLFGYPDPVVRIRLTKSKQIDLVD